MAWSVKMDLSPWWNNSNREVHLTRIGLAIILADVDGPFEGRGTSRGSNIFATPKAWQIHDIVSQTFHPGHFVPRGSVIIERWTASRFKVCVCVCVSLPSNTKIHIEGMKRNTIMKLLVLI